MQRDSQDDIEESLQKVVHSHWHDEWDEVYQHTENFVKTDLEETSLMHVCHKHLLRLADHFDLQVKMLNSAELRNWLCQCWEHRSNLIAFKMSFQSTLWWHLKSRSWCICKMFYQIKSLKIIWIWLSKSNHQWDCKIFDMRQLSRDRKSDDERCF